MDAKNVKIVDCYGYYDGAVCGVCKHEDDFFIFRLAGDFFDSDKVDSRLYVMRRLNSDEILLLKDNEAMKSLLGGLTPLNAGYYILSDDSGHTFDRWWDARMTGWP